MSWKRILLHLDGTPAAGDRIEAAANLAHRFAARLTGLYAVNGAEVAASGGRERRQVLADQVAAAEAAFRRQTGDLGLAAEWAQAVGTEAVQVNNDVLHAARHHDVCILGQNDTERDDATVPRDLVDQVVARSGRPVLVVPFAGHHPDIARRPVVAWNGSREAARALSDALPLLKQAHTVTILRLAATGRARPMPETPLLDLTEYCAAHGIEAHNDQLTIDSAAIGMAEAFLSYLAQEAVDLLVIGSAGEIQPRSGRSLSRDVLARAAVPVLMSH